MERICKKERKMRYLKEFDFQKYSNKIVTGTEEMNPAGREGYDNLLQIVKKKYVSQAKRTVFYNKTSLL